MWIGRLYLVAFFSFFSVVAHAESASNAPKPFRTYITLNQYSLTQTGNPDRAPVEISVKITLPNGQKFALPDDKEAWTLAEGQVQPIHRTIALPANMVKNDGFDFEVQIVRNGANIMPCRFQVVELSHFNRVYTCATDVAWQRKNNVLPNEEDKEGIEVRVFTDLKSNSSTIASDLARR